MPHSGSYQLQYVHLQYLHFQQLVSLNQAFLIFPQIFELANERFATIIFIILIFVFTLLTGFIANGFCVSGVSLK